MFAVHSNGAITSGPPIAVLKGEGSVVNMGAMDRGADGCAILAGPGGVDPALSGISVAALADFPVESGEKYPEALEGMGSGHDGRRRDKVAFFGRNVKAAVGGKRPQPGKRTCTAKSAKIAKRKLLV